MEGTSWAGHAKWSDASAEKETVEKLEEVSAKLWVAKGKRTREDERERERDRRREKETGGYTDIRRQTRT